MGKNLILIMITLSLTCLCLGRDSEIDKTVVKDFEIERYLGKWYELARFDHRFERDLVGVTATYSWRDDGKIKVDNEGYKKYLDGKRTKATGKAKIPDLDVPAKLKVSFFLFFYADYFVLELDENYQWVIVGSKSDKYLWILSRTPQMGENLYNQLLDKITSRGYDITKLIKVKQKLN